MLSSNSIVKLTQVVSDADSTNNQLSFLETLVDSHHLAHLQMLAPAYYVFGTRAAAKWRDISDEQMSKVAQRIHAGEPWEEVIHQQTQEKKWVHKIALSPSRSLFLDLLDYSGVRVALDLGAGWGQLSLGLATRVPQVVSVETTKERLDVIHAICAQEDKTNVSFLLGDVFDLPFREGSFDLVLLCGVYEWLGNNGTEDDVKMLQEAALKAVFHLLSPGGKVVIAIENRIGLKYLLGERDDHSKTRHISYLPYQEASAQYQHRYEQSFRARTYDQREYEASLAQTGFISPQFYLAFPDYKLPQVIIPSDQPELLRYVVENIPMPDEHDGSDGSRSFYNEVIKRVYRGINNVDVLQHLAPSFIIVAERPQ